MYKFNTELNSENKEDVLSLPNEDTRKSRSSSTASSVISSLPGDYSDIALEDCFEMLAQLAPEALVSASLSKRYCIVYAMYISALCHNYRPDQRTEEDIECIYDEMVNIKAFSHFSQTVCIVLCAIVCNICNTTIVLAHLLYNYKSYQKSMLLSELGALVICHSVMPDCSH